MTKTRDEIEMNSTQTSRFMGDIQQSWNLRAHKAHGVCTFGKLSTLSSESQRTIVNLKHFTSSRHDITPR